MRANVLTASLFLLFEVSGFFLEQSLADALSFIPPVFCVFS
jgi:hypothetical protein